jgi:hypothetical protein
MADYFTKPLQGELFYKFRDQIMGVVPMETIHGHHRSVLDQESPDHGNKKNVVRLVGKPKKHHSWADVVKSRSPTNPKRMSLASLKR